MASSCSERHDGSLFQSKKICFFKIILEDTVRDKKLAIPRSFVKKYGNALSNRAILRIPDGVSWKMELFKGSDVWLSEGWQEFADYYYVKLAHLLLFKYEGDSQFSVVIFSKTAVEIDYPLRSTHQDFKFQDLKREETEDGVSDEAMDVHSPSPTRSHQEIEQPWLRPYHNEKTLQRASAFKSKNPLMVITMRPSYVPPAGSKMNLPERFCRKYLLTSEDYVVHLVSGGKIWPAGYAHDEEGRARVRLQNGWKAFATDNHLEIGDVCVFELIKSTGGKITFEVHIFRVAEDGASDSSLVKLQRHEKPPPCSIFPPPPSQSARKIVSKNPFFSVVMQESYLHLYLHIPAGFARRHSKHWKKNNITLQVEDRSWIATLKNFDSCSRITGGWAHFARENFLKVGDVCKFELIDRKKMVLKVSIFRSEN